MATILEQYRDQRRKLHGAYIQPTRITFSLAGYRKMMAEADSMTLMLNTATPAGQPPTYDNLPYSVVNTQAEEVKVHNAMTDTGRQRAISIKGTMGKLGGEPKTMVQLVASSLDSPTLCDIIMEWLAACTDIGPFEIALRNAVEQHGKFE